MTGQRNTGRLRSHLGWAGSCTAGAGQEHCQSDTTAVSCCNRPDVKLIATAAPETYRFRGLCVSCLLVGDYAKEGFLI